MDADDRMLCAADISTILQSKLQTAHYELLNFKVEPFQEEIGFLGDHAKLKIVIQYASETEPTELSFFVKFFPAQAMSAEFARETGAFQKELFTNRVIFTNMKKAGIEIIKQCTAECHLAEQSRVLVFDDLTVEGFEAVGKDRTFDYDTTLVVLKSLAKLHASSLIYEEKKSLELGTDYRLTMEYESNFQESLYTDTRSSINPKWVQAAIKGVLTEIELFEQATRLSSGKYFKAVAEKYCYEVYNLVKPSSKFRNVVSHGDLWSTNLLLKFSERGEPVACKFVDFQMTRYMPPAHDVMAVLHLTTARELRQKHMYELIGLYYVALETHLKLAGYDIKTIVPFADFLHSCEEQKLFALIQTATYFQLVLLNSEELKAFFANSTLSSYAIHEDRSALVLGHINREEYRERLRESIQDLRDYCEWR